MNREWIKAKESEYAAIAQARRAEIITKINSAELLTYEDKKTLENILDKECGQWYNMFETAAILGILENHDKKDDKFVMDFVDIGDFVRSLSTDEYNSDLYKANGGLKRYLDSEPMEFDSDIIITDPCYIMRAEHHGTTPITDNDWDACECGDKMEVLGIGHYMTRDTLYGDWSCTVYNTDTKEAIGEFCADAGLVSVFSLDEVLKYNPDFDYHKERDWTTTLIPDFKGTVQFVVGKECMRKTPITGGPGTSGRTTVSTSSVTASTRRPESPLTSAAPRPDYKTTLW